MREMGLLGCLVGMEIGKILVRPKSFLPIWRETRLILLLSSCLLFLPLSCNVLIGISLFDFFFPFYSFFLSLMVCSLSLSLSLSHTIFFLMSFTLFCFFFSLYSINLCIILGKMLIHSVNFEVVANITPKLLFWPIYFFSIIHLPNKYFS